ncbi:PREDICTED: NAC domain-containing protein 92-like [Nelumbo nucifera]|uniref:NAC domain-containing protein n=2 Tax=Nelumbo nucifera TaxID=4432 RepID=A0A822Z1I4_NELNU|nr:PREDICTED: NAC domain-containing protein 92-like [Nelumbo nucifera]DAD35358.1 TPA_asm: hypothetical protein HUJ06_005998 [Nelumbo nucifera]
MEGNLPPGFRFHPTDEELITYYLTRKVSDSKFVSRAIAVVDLNKCEPWDLPGKASMGEKEWYFFSLRDRKYPTGLRTNRATDAGYWKTTGKDKEIFHCGVVAGLKKTLVFYKGRAPKGEKSNWVMHEYRLETKFTYKPIKEEWVVCRVFQKSATSKKPEFTPLHASLESNCDAGTLMNELEGIGLFPDPSSTVVNSSSSCFGAISSNNNNSNNDISCCVVNPNMNWVPAREATNDNNIAPLSWPTPGLLSSNLSMNSMILRALQLGGYQLQPREKATMTDLSSSIHPDPVLQENSRFITDLNSNFPASSSSKAIDADAVQQQPLLFNLDSTWRSC